MRCEAALDCWLRKDGSEDFAMVPGGDDEVRR
jgi:hypothetical protein